VAPDIVLLVENMKIINALNRARYSLSARFLWLFIIMAILLMFIVGGNIALSIKNNFKENIRPHLMQYLEYVQKDIGTPPNKLKALEISEKLSVDIFIISESEHWSSNNTTIDLSGIKYYKQFVENDVKYSTGELEDLEVLVVNHDKHTIVFSILHPKNHYQHRHGLPLFLIIVLLTGFYFVIRKLFLPIKTLESGIKRIGSGELQHRIELHRKDELGSLANNINQMADDIQQMLESKRQLLLAISHELRSPLTRTKIALDLMPENRHSQSIKEDLQEIEQLIEEILETERLSTSHAVIHETDTSLDEILSKVVTQHFSQHTPQLEIVPNDYRVHVDVPRIKLLMKNIIDNAISHTPSDKPSPLISLKTNENNIVLSVKDYGEGIDEHHLPHLMEPFYRVDPSRQRDTGGYGLGLYLCKIIAQVHGGNLQITSEKNSGTTVIFTLPTK